MKRLLAIILAAFMALSLVACESEPKEPEVAGIFPDDYDVSALTSPDIKYTLEELETLSKTELAADSVDAPALYKYFNNMLIGCAFGYNQCTNLNTPIAKSLLKHYNVFVLGNECKPAYINPAEGVFRFDDVDGFVEFGAINDVTLRGHTLLWHAQVPDWWFKADPADTRSPRECYEQGALATREQLTERLTTFITEYVTRYKDDIDVWDLCNEVLNADSIRTVNDDSYWAEIIGDVDGNGFKDDYVEIAANAARAADEDAVLVINDFNMEWQTSKTQAMYDMVERMLRKGVRIDGVGFQSHIGLDCNVELYRSQIAKIAGLADVYDECFPEHKGNFRVQITELDMNMFVGADSDGAYKKWTDEDYQKQADKYAELFDMFQDFADEGIIDMVVLWGTDDGGSWLNSTPKLRRNAALLILREEEGFLLKPCFWSIAKTSFDHYTVK